MLSIILAAVLVQQPLAPINVTAPRANPLPADTLDSAEVRRDIRPALAVVMSSIPGVRAITTGYVIAKPVIRGLGGARVLTLDAGQRLETYSWDDEDGPPLDPRLGEGIEVIRGPASLLYGSDAIGGVINSLPGPLPEADGSRSIRRLRAELFGSSNNPGVGANAEGAWARGAWGGRLSLAGHFAGPISTPVCELENTGFSSLNGEAAVGVHGRSGRASLRIARYAGEFKLLEAGGAGFTAPPGCPGGPPKPPADTGEGGPERKVDDMRVQLAGETRAGGMTLEARAQLQHHGTIELSDDVVPGVETETINLGLTTGLVDLLAHHRLGMFSGTIGVSGMLQDNKSTGAAPLVPDGNIRNVAAFLIERLPLGRVTLLGGVRVDARRTHADSNATLAVGAKDRNATAFTGDVGVAFELARGVSFTTNLGRAFRAPNLFELFSNGPRLGEARYEIGDATMEPEVSLNADASLRWRVDRFRGEITAYRNRIEHFIYITPTGQYRQTGTPANPDSLRVFQYGQASRATLVGGEVSLALDLTHRIAVWARGDAVKGDNDTQNSPLPLMPPLRVVTGARYHVARWYAGAEVEAVRKQDRLSTFDVQTPGYVLLGFEGGYVLRLGSRTFDIDARVRNATDKQYRNYLSRYKEFALDAGRSLEVRVGTEF